VSCFLILFFLLVSQAIPDEPDTEALPGDTDVEPPHSSTPAITRPHSYETDPDPAKTTHCTTSYQPHLPLVQYALMIDAGSTGSRIHIYKFNHCGPTAAYEYETFKMTQPGLSAFASDPVAAAQSLDGLLNEAVRIVPLHLRSCTPVAVKATAGLRFLPGNQSGEILRAVEARIKSRYPFKLAGDGRGVVVMDGKEEAVYAWITANYLLGTIGAHKDKNERKGTYAVLDLGGASTQIVFEPVFTIPGKHLEEGEHKYELKFAGNTHVLYQHSYLGYGLMRARRHVHTLVDFMASMRATPPSERERKEGMVGNPCLARGTRKVVEVVDERSGEARNVTMDGDEIGSFEACDKILQLVLAKDAYVVSFSFNLFLVLILHTASVTSNLALSTVSTNLPSSILSPAEKYSCSLTSTTASALCSLPIIRTPLLNIRYPPSPLSHTSFVKAALPGFPTLYTLIGVLPHPSLPSSKDVQSGVST